jgi:lysophospholipase L1-like esterase
VTDDCGKPGEPGARRFGSFVAIGDSFTEGVDDPLPTGGYRGWAKLVAEYLTAREPGLRYTNLGKRGKTLREIIDEQLPQALEMRPGLVTLNGGANDLIRPSGDMDTVFGMLDDIVRRLREIGSEVLLFTGGDTSEVLPRLRRIRERNIAYTKYVDVLAERYGICPVDLWSGAVLRNPRLWSTDRMHPNAEGHRLVAGRVCEALGVPVPADWQAPPSPSLSTTLPVAPGIGRAR